MKRYIFIILCFFLITGCQTSENKENTDERLYQQYLKYYTKLKNHKNFVATIEEC